MRRGIPSIYPLLPPLKWEHGLPPPSFYHAIPDWRTWASLLVNASYTHAYVCINSLIYVLHQNYPPRLIPNENLPSILISNTTLALKKATTSQVLRGQFCNVKISKIECEEENTGNGKELEQKDVLLISSSLSKEIGGRKEEKVSVIRDSQEKICIGGQCKHPEALYKQF